MRDRKRPRADACLVLLAVVAASGLGGCGGHPTCGDGVVVVSRLTDHLPPSPSEAIERGAGVDLAGDRRRALSSRRPFTVPVDAADASHGGHALDVPAALAGEPRVEVQRSAERPHRPWGEILEPNGRRRLELSPSSVDGTKPIAVLRGALTLAEHDVETDSIVIPPCAHLEVAAGVDRRVSSETDTTFETRIVALDGDRPIALDSRTIDADRESPMPWTMRRIDLGALSGRNVRFRFSVRRTDGTVWSAALPVWGEPIILAPPAAPAPPGGVILVSLDTLRARSTSPYGSARPTTPALERLAADGVVFESAFSTAAFTLPSHASIMTGLWARTHGAFSFFTPMPPDRPTLAERLADAGFGTAAMTEGGWVSPTLGFARGFDVFHTFDRGGRRGGTVRSAVYADGIAWLRTVADRPFFLFLHEFTVHAPYRPPPEYERLFPLDTRTVSKAERLRRLYEQEARWQSDQLETFLDELDGLGIADRTMIVVLADHGEEFMEHGGWQHTHQVTEEVARVPLIVRWPGRLPAGRRIAEPVSLADVGPTIVDLLGLPPIPGAEGTSLAPLLRGGASRLAREGVYTEAASSKDALETRDRIAVRTRTHTCIRDGSRGTACFDRAADPDEVKPLPPESETGHVAEAKRLLDTYEARGQTARTPITLPDGVAGSAVEDRLRALGYLQ